MIDRLAFYDSLVTSGPVRRHGVPAFNLSLTVSAASALEQNRAAAVMSHLSVKSK